VSQVHLMQINPAQQDVAAARVARSTNALVWFGSFDFLRISDVRSWGASPGSTGSW
jgi:hypothetical protein